MKIKWKNFVSSKKSTNKENLLKWFSKTITKSRASLFQTQEKKATVNLVNTMIMAKRMKVLEPRKTPKKQMLAQI